MFCTKCGTQVQEGRQFCGNCGASLRPASDVRENRPAQPTRAVQQQRVPWSKTKKLVVAAILCIAAGAYGGDWWWQHRPIPDYKVKDPGIYLYQGLGPDGSSLKVGFVNSNGKILSKPQWDAVAQARVMGRTVECNEGFCGVEQNGKWGFVDKNGKLVIPIQFNSVSPFVDGVARVSLGNEVGYIDTQGNYVVNPQFSDGGDFHEGFAAAKNSQGWGFINKSGNFVIKPHFSSVDSSGFSEGLAAVCTSSCGYITQTGKFAIKPQFESVGTFSDGLAAVEMGGKWGYVNHSGKFVVNPQFDKASVFIDGEAIVDSSDQIGTINKNGRYVVNPGEYSVVDSGSALLKVTNNGKWGLMTRTGKWVLKPSGALSGISIEFGHAFLGLIANRWVPVSNSGTVLAGWYKGANLGTLADDIKDEAEAQTAMQQLVNAEGSYSNAFPAIGFASSLTELGPSPNGNTDEKHAGLIDAALATGAEYNYQFSLTIPSGNSTGGTTFNYLLTATPLSGHAGRIFCANSTGTIRYAVQGHTCSTAAPLSPTASSRTLSAQPSSSTNTQRVSSQPVEIADKSLPNNFSDEYGWYVATIKHSVLNNWNEEEVNPQTPLGSRVRVGFSVEQDGTISNIHILRSSSSPTLNTSALQALERTNNLGALPSGYREKTLSVEFTFTYKGSAQADSVKLLSLTAVDKESSRSRPTYPPFLVGQQAPNFTLVGIRGNKVSLAGYRGKAVVVNFWATWCGPCLIETPWLNQLNKKFASQGLTILGVATDSIDPGTGENDPPGTVAKFAQQHNMNYTILMANLKVAYEYGGIDSIPTAFFIDRSGKVVATTVGLVPEQDIEAGIQKALARG